MYIMSPISFKPGGEVVQKWADSTKCSYKISLLFTILLIK